MKYPKSDNNREDFTTFRPKGTSGKKQLLEPRKKCIAVTIRDCPTPQKLWPFKDEFGH